MIHEATLMIDGSLASRDQFDPATIHGGVLKKVEQALRKRTPHAQITQGWTVDSLWAGSVLSAQVRYQSSLIAQVLLFAGDEPGRENELILLYVRGLQQAVAKDLPVPHQPPMEILGMTQRPLAVSIVFPAPSREVQMQMGDLSRCIAAAWHEIIQEARNAP